MSKFLDIKRKARMNVHKHMHIFAFFFKCADTAFGSPTPIDVRLHYDYGLVGDQPGTSFQYAERAEMTDAAIIYKIEDFPNLENGDVVTTERGDAYTVEYLDPADDFTRKAHLTKMHSSQTKGLAPYPGGGTV